MLDISALIFSGVMSCMVLTMFLMVKFIFSSLSRSESSSIESFLSPILMVYIRPKTVPFVYLCSMCGIVVMSRLGRVCDTSA